MAERIGRCEIGRELTCGGIAIFFALCLITLLLLYIPLAFAGGAFEDIASSASALIGDSPAHVCSVPGDYSTIQEAVDDANCATISVGSGVFSEEVTINGSVKIAGQGAANSEVNGNFVTDCNFFVEPGGMVTLTGLSITKAGRCGVYNRGGTVIIDHVDILVNDIGMINSEGKATIINSSIYGNAAFGGGGIYNGGELTIKNSSIYGNTTGHEGGGINNSGTVTIDSSTISGNLADYEGSGIYNTGKLTINNSTISSNGGYYLGGGIYNLGTIVLRNSMIVNSLSGTDCKGIAIFSQGYNIDSDNSCNLTAPGDMPNHDPQLGPLQDNGGATFTHVLLSGSPVIDAGSCPGAHADQRDYARPVDVPDVLNVADACDIGAFEFRIMRDHYLPVTARP